VLIAERRQLCGLWILRGTATSPKNQEEQECQVPAARRSINYSKCEFGSAFQKCHRILHEPSSTVLKLLNSLIFSASKCVWSHQCKWGCQTGAKNWKYGRHNSWILAHAKSCNKSQKGALQHLDQQWDNSSNSFCFILIPVQHHLMGSKKPGKNMLWRWFHVYLQQKCEAWNCAQFHVLWLAISI